jgi:hypothetical protein
MATRRALINITNEDTGKEVLIADYFGSLDEFLLVAEMVWERAVLADRRVEDITQEKEDGS